MKKRVVVTGLGVISSAGCTVEKMWTKVRNGTCCSTRVIFEKYEKIPCKVAATISSRQLESLKQESGIPENKFRAISKSTFFAILAARQAITDAGLQEYDSKLKQNVGVAIGSGIFDFEDVCDTKSNLDRSYNRISPYFLSRNLLNMSAGNISMEFGFRGPNHCVSTACATGAHSIGDSFKMIQNEMSVAMVCGSTEACINPLTMAGFCRMRALSCNFNDRPHEASRPFDELRDGFVMGEGAAVLVLEEMEHAVRRKAAIYAEIIGYGMSGDAFDLTLPSPSGEGAKLSMRRAVDDADISVTDVNYVNAHATSTPIGDPIELTAIGDVFEQSSQVYVSSTKGCHGHLLGAAGSIETLCTVLACYHGIIPPTANLKNCCERIANVECNSKEEIWTNKTKRIAVKNSFGFGGTNASLCIAQFKE